MFVEEMEICWSSLAISSHSSDVNGIVYEELVFPRAISLLAWIGDVFVQKGCGEDGAE